MKALLLAVGVISLLVTAAYHLACWVKGNASQKVKDRLVLGLLVTFAAGLFVCFSLRAAFALASLIAACVAADFLTRKGRSSGANQQH